MSTRSPGRSGTLNSVIVPGDGWKPWVTSSAFSRHSIAWPAMETSVLREPKRSTVGDLQLECDEVPSGDGLADRMLDLDAAVDLEEEELLGDGIDDELDGSEVAITDRARKRDRRVVQRVARLAADSAGAGDSSTTF